MHPATVPRLAPVTPEPLQPQTLSSAHLIGRALRLLCPNCGSGSLFRRWVVMARFCPRCNLMFDRGEADYFLGSYVVNFVVAELLIVCGAGVTILLSLPDVPWAGLKRWLFVLAALTPIVFYPFAKTLWLALDLNFRPVTTGDFHSGGGDREDSEGHREGREERG